MSPHDTPTHRQRRARRRANTLIELVLTMVLIGIVAAIAVPSIRTMLDRLHVKGAEHDVVLGLWAARNAASLRGDYASFIANEGAGTVRVVTGGDTVFRRDISASRGVKMTVTRDSITYAPTGIGWGAANTRIIVSRGKRADTITTSRMGRVSF